MPDEIEEITEEATEQSKTPITDAVNEQFDQWDADLAEWRKENREWVEKKLKQLAKDIEAWIKKQTEALKKDKEDTENSAIAKALAKIEEDFATLKALFEKLGSEVSDAIDAVKELFKTIQSIVKWIEQIMKDIVSKIADITLAITTIGIRGPITLANCRPL